MNLKKIEWIKTLEIAASVGVATVVFKAIGFTIFIDGLVGASTAVTPMTLATFITPTLAAVAGLGVLQLLGWLYLKK